MATNFLELATTLKYLGAKWLPGKKVNFTPCSWNIFRPSAICIACWLLEMARVCRYSCSHAKYGQIMFEAVYSLVEMLMTDIEREVNFFLSYDIIHAHPIFLASIPSLRLL